MHSKARRATSAVGLGAVIALIGCATLSPRQLEGTRSIGVPGGVLEVFVHGAGSPAVVFESGAGAQCRMGNWAKVIESLRGEARLFAYNRSGYGRSRIRRSLDDPRDVVEILHRGLNEVGVEPPYLLVGHSLGGLYMNLFARLYPDEVSGLVFVDSSHAWLGPARRFLRTWVLPNATAFTVSLILFETALAIMILMRGDLVLPALIAGTIFCVIAAVVSSPGGTAGNLALAALQLALALSR